MEEGENHLSCLSWEPGHTPVWYGEMSHQWVPVNTQTWTHKRTHKHTHMYAYTHKQSTSLCSICSGCVRLRHNIFFTLVNCLGAIYFPLRRWRWFGARATLVGADKLLLARRRAGGTRFTRKTMSTRSDLHIPKHTDTDTLTNIHTHNAHFCDYTHDMTWHQLRFYHNLWPLCSRNIPVVFKLVFG